MKRNMELIRNLLLRQIGNENSELKCEAYTTEEIASCFAF